MLFDNTNTTAFFLLEKNDKKICFQRELCSISDHPSTTCCLTQDVFKIISYKPYFVVDFVASDKLESSLDWEF